MYRNINFRKLILPVFIAVSAIAVIAQRGQQNLWKHAADAPVLEEPLQMRVTGEDPWVELERISQLYRNENEVFGTGQIALRKEGEDDILEKSTFRALVKGQNFHYHIDSVDMIYNNGLSLHVFHREKLMIVDKGKSVATSPWSLASMDSLQTYAQRAGTQLSVHEDAEFKMIRVVQTGHPDLYGYELYYERATYHIKKVKLLFATTQAFEEDSTGDSGTISKEEAEGASGAEENASLWFRMQEVVLSYQELRVTQEKKAFQPEQAFIRLGKKTIQVNTEYQDYRVVLLNDTYQLAN